jgi:endonuclease/exonuclease/phosphatase family metal-dependent hydrolase
MPVVEEPFRILAWNVNHRICRRSMPPAYAEAILSFEPDVVVLTEYVEGDDHASFCAALRAGGLAYQCHTAFERRHNHVLIASWTPFTIGTLLPPNRLPHAVSNWLHVRLTDPSLDLVGLRVPVESRSENRAYWNWFESAIQRLLASPAVIIGDLNADPRVPKRLGTHHLNSLKQAGWKLPDPEGEWSFIGKGGQTSRLDHALISPSVTFNKAEYFPSVPEYIFASPKGKLSDHAPLVLDISRPGQSRKQDHHHDPTENACWRDINVVVHDPADQDIECDATQDRGSSIPSRNKAEPVSS